MGVGFGVGSGVGAAGSDNLSVLFLGASYPPWNA
jgi:hypothetical protein